MTHLDMLWAFVLIGIALLLGKGLRTVFPALAALFLPSSILGGALVFWLAAGWLLFGRRGRGRG